MQSVCDAHLHIIDPAFPLWENNGYLPASFTVKQYLQQVQSLNVRSGAIVSGSFQCFDQTYLVSALKQLGKEFVGVTQLPVTTTDEQILELDRQGVRALRFNLKRGGSEAVTELDCFARRVHELASWHVEVYADYQSLEQLKSVLCSLPAVSIDHLGLNKVGLPLLEVFAENGVKIKATGFSRLDFDPFPVIKKLYEINSEALLFGTDLPSTRAPEAFNSQHFYKLLDVLGEQGAEKVCWANARAFYGFVD